jgi:sugar lactone lactonase YvrE
MAVRDGELKQVADMYERSGLPCNDMVVDERGRVFVGSVGSGVDEAKYPGPGNMPHFSHILLVEFAAGSAATPGQVHIVADRMTTPNGSVITPDGRTLIVAESFGFRLTAFDIEEDGSLANRRIWADLGVPPDGICLDQEGCIWVAVPYYQYGGAGGYIRVEEGGKVRQRLDVEGYSPYACTLGGAEMKTLFLCESAILGLPRHPGDGRICLVDVEVPGTGSP